MHGRLFVLNCHVSCVIPETILCPSADIVSLSKVLFVRKMYFCVSFTTSQIVNLVRNETKKTYLTKSTIMPVNTPIVNKLMVIV